ncbi:MAG TPA: flagellar hook-associated protein FlgK [Candidatus Marinimicrobia bacterium]|nr:flagellar hook-associated protein FlgK [Candidatus Neomarinimicrobiota bacterium]
MSISRIFETTKRSLLTQQLAINATANNIANVNTEGYTRRRIDLSRLSLGFNGMDSEATMRVRNRFLENQLWYEKQELGKNSMNEMLFQQIEGILGEPSDSGLSNIMTEFWNSWTNLASNPESDSARTLVKDKGVLLGNTFNRLDKNLKNLQLQTGQEIQQKVNEINGIVNQIKGINKQIRAQRSNDLLDRQDMLINQLASKIDIQVNESNNGVVTIVAGGNILISGSYSNQLHVKTSQATNGVFHIEIEMTNGNKKANITSGELGGLLEVHNDHVAGYIDKLNTMAISLKDVVNNIHSSGYNLDGVTGIDFFNDNISGAGDFAVSDEIIFDPSLVATSSTVDTPGDGSIAQLVADLQNSDTTNGTTLSDFYNSLVTELGNKVQEAQFVRENQERIVEQLNNQKAAVSGVSLDEEMTNLIQYERAYQAAARMISTVDDLMDTVLRMV